MTGDLVYGFELSCWMDVYYFHCYSPLWFLATNILNQMPSSAMNRINGVNKVEIEAIIMDTTTVKDYGFHRYHSLSTLCDQGF